MQTIIITGINGFVGQHLARQAQASGCQVIGVGQGDKPHAGLEPILKAYFSCDLTERTGLKDIPFEEADCLINLAGLANVGASFDNPHHYEDVNVGILRNLCDELLDRNLRTCRILAISTGAVYDPTGQPPFSEDSPLVDANNTSPYVQSKLLTEAAAEAYNKRGLLCITVRPFNHIGPGQLPGFILPDLTRQLSLVKDSGVSSISVGNLQNQRDFTDVRDVVKAYTLLATTDASKLQHTVYNVCSGRGLSGSQILLLLEEALGVKDVTVEVDQSLIRASDPAIIIGSSLRLSRETGWQPTIPIEQTVKDFVSWYTTQN